MNRKFKLSVLVAITLGISGIFQTTLVPQKVVASELVTETTKTTSVEAQPSAPMSTLVEQRERTVETDTVTKNVSMAKSTKSLIRKMAARPAAKPKRLASSKIIKKTTRSVAFNPLVTERHERVVERTSVYQPLALSTKPVIVEKTALVEKETPAVLETTKIIERPTIVRESIVEKPAIQEKVIEKDKVIERPMIIEYKPSFWDRFWDF